MARNVLDEENDLGAKLRPMRGLSEELKPKKSSKKKSSRSESSRVSKCVSCCKGYFQLIFTGNAGRRKGGALKQLIARSIFVLVLFIVVIGFYGKRNVLSLRGESTDRSSISINNQVQLNNIVADSDDSDAIPEQQNFKVKSSVKLDKKEEIALACKQVECEDSCVKKAKSSCTSKRSCLTDRQKLCKRRCLKTRCEARCVNEPHYGYVEREQKMEKCKEGCSGTNTAAHNKCIKKCHSEFKPCKSRCHEIAYKYTCDQPKPEPIPMLYKETAEEDTPEEPDEEDEEGGDDVGSEDSIDDADAPSSLSEDEDI